MTLAADNEPLVLADGTKINPVNGKVMRDREPSQFVEVPSASEAQRIVARTRRSINELPLATGSMNALSLCLLYTLWGLGDPDIAIAAGLSVEQVKRIKSLPQYDTLSSDIVRTIAEHEATDIRQFFQRKAKGAAQKIVEIAEDGDGVLGFKAAQDVLDRAGFRPADIVEHKHSLDGALRIEHIVKRETNDLPAINTTYREVG